VYTVWDIFKIIFGAKMSGKTDSTDARK